MKCIVVGCGRQGARLAQLLYQHQHYVTVIDEDAENLKRLGTRFKGQVINAVVFDRQTLLAAGIERTDALAAVTNNDDANIVTALLARNVFRVPNVITRVYDPRKADIYGRLGLQTISPIELGATHIFNLLVRSALDTELTFGSGEMSIVRAEVPPGLAGRQLTDLTIPGEIAVVAITRQNKAFIPTQATCLEAGDLLHVAILFSASDRLQQLLQLH